MSEITQYVPSNKKQRTYTEKQQSFLDNLIRVGGDAKVAAELAGYADNVYPQVVRTLKEEIIELASEILAQSAPKAAMKLVEVMESETAIPQSNVKVQAAQTILDRIGLGKMDRVDVNHNIENNTGALFILPAKKPSTIEAEYEIPEDET
tara:strand:- start:4463 stop:4912 length:450 start_codon:yes stop_codon:yes gene_type:complete